MIILLRFVSDPDQNQAGTHDPGSSMFSIKTDKQSQSKRCRKNYSFAFAVKSADMNV